MRKLLLVTFDLIRKGETTPAYSVASLLARLRREEDAKRLRATHICVNVFAHTPTEDSDAFARALHKVEVRQFDAVAISAYIWAGTLVNPLIRYLRQRGFRGRIILGGYQIAANIAAEVERAYPGANVFLSGFAEESLVEAVLSPAPARWTRKPVNFGTLPSPWLEGIIPLRHDQPMVRMETVRGCPFACTFCRHRDVEGDRVERLAEQRSHAELELFHRHRVRKINVLDPVFNGGPRALRLLRHAVEVGFTGKLSLQCRFESVTPAFLDLCAELNVILEFGLQTIDPAEALTIGRPNDIAKVDTTIAELNRRAIDYEVSMIYGLPGQAPDSFRRGLDWLDTRGCGTIRAFPLMLLPGTPLHAQCGRHGFRIRPIGPWAIPHAVASHSYTEAQWEEMHALAATLEPSPIRLT